MQIFLQPDVKIKSIGNYIYLTNDARSIEIELETEQFVSDFVDAFKSNDFKDKLMSVLGVQETSELLKRLEEERMITSEDPEEITAYPDFSFLEEKCKEEIIETKLKPGDTLNAIYDALYTSNYKDLFYQSFSIAVNEYENPIWKSRNPQLDSSVIQGYGFATTLIPIRDHHGKQKLIYGFGASSEGVESATALAMLECLERIYTMYKAPVAVVKNAAFSDLRATTDPSRYNVFAHQQYGAADFEFRPFLPESELDWIRAKSLTKDKSVLLPRALLTSDGLDKNYVPVSSNGCAIHTCSKKALLSGMEEIIERDSLLKSWYQMKALPVLVDGTDILEKNNIGKIILAIGFKITLLDGTNDLNIPVIIGIFEDSMNPSLFTVNAATAETPDQAVDKLCREFFALWRDYILDENFVFPKYESDSLKTLSSHFEFYQRTTHLKERGFLKSSRSVKKSTDMNWQKSTNTEQRTNYLVNELAMRKLDVLYVDCTSDLQRNIGLSTVRVIIPGTIPLFVGTALPLGIKRLTSTKQLNSLPHPYC